MVNRKSREWEGYGERTACERERYGKKAVVDCGAEVSRPPPIVSSEEETLVARMQDKLRCIMREIFMSCSRFGSRVCVGNDESVLLIVKLCQR